MKTTFPYSLPTLEHVTTTTITQPFDFLVNGAAGLSEPANKTLESLVPQHSLADLLQSPITLVTLAFGAALGIAYREYTAYRRSVSQRS